MDTFFAVCAPGLVDYTAAELKQLGLVPASPVKAPGAAEEGGGVELQGDRAALYRLNLHLRTASRVLVRLGEFYAAAFSELRKKAGRLEWERYLAPGQNVALRVSCRQSRLYHSGAVAERIAGAIADRLGQPPVIQKTGESGESSPSQLIVVRLLHDLCTISVDSSGELLHRRGYRLETAKAPLRETLAAGLLMASGWDLTTPLVDPFCGSGAIPVEAALMARGIPPGRHRSFAFMGWRDFDASLWNSLISESDSRLQSTAPPILASDRDAGAIRMAQANAERAGVAGDIEFSCRAVSDLVPPPGPGWVVTNPPYGLRVRSNKDLRDLYARFGQVLRQKCPGWQVAILSSDLRLLGNTGLKLSTGLSLINGGVPVKAGMGTVER